MPKREEKKTKSAPKLSLQSKNLRVGLTALVLVAGIVALLFTSGVFSGNFCTKAYRNDKQVTINGKVFETEQTKTAQEKQKGLGGRDCIGDNQAMLFNLASPGQQAMVMRDMNFSIDVLWVSEDKKIVAIEKNFAPDTYPEAAVNEAGRPALYVLEVEAGTADELGLQLGTPVSF